MVWYSHLFQHFPHLIVIHTVEGFGIVNKAEIDVFLELAFFFVDPTDVGNLISGSSAFSISSLNIWKFTFHVLLKPGLENLSITLRVFEMSEIVWLFDHSLDLPFLGIGMKSDFSSAVAMAVFSKFAGILSVALLQYHLVGFEKAQYHTLTKISIIL